MYMYQIFMNLFKDQNLYIDEKENNNIRNIKKKKGEIII